MRYQRTQIYLDPEQHKALLKEARERGISMAAYLREIVASRNGEQAPAHGDRSWERFFGIISAGPAREYADPDEEVGEAVEWVYEKKYRSRGKNP